MAEPQLLWVCHRCEMIGDAAEAQRHVEATGHGLQQLDQETSDAVRAQQHEDRLTGLMLLGRTLKPASDEGQAEHGG